MKRTLQRSGLLASLVTLSCLSLSSVASAVPQVGRPVTAVADSAKPQTIITKGDQEISRRLTSLGTLTSKINAATKLSASDKASLSSEVSAEISGLTALKSKLDAETTTAGARTDAQSIFTDYRVYALIVPKVELIKTADDQQVVETKLAALATKLQSRLTSAQSAGKDVTALQAKLTDLNSQVMASTAISSGIEVKVINLQPSDYDSDHTILSGDAAQLKTAHANDQAAIADAKAIVSGLKSL